MFACKLNMLSYICCSMDKSSVDGGVRRKKINGFMYAQCLCQKAPPPALQLSQLRGKESRHKLKITTFHVFITINFTAVVKLQSEKYEIKIFHSFSLPWRDDVQWIS